MDMQSWTIITFTLIIIILFIHQLFSITMNKNSFFFSYSTSRCWPKKTTFVPLLPSPSQPSHAVEIAISPNENNCLIVDFNKNALTKAKKIDNVWGLIDRTSQNHFSTKYTIRSLFVLLIFARANYRCQKIKKRLIWYISKT